MTTLEIGTSDPIIKLNPECTELILELNKIQPKLHDRVDKKLKRRQADYILNQTRHIFLDE